MAAQKYAAIQSVLWVSDGGSPETFFKVASCGDTSGPKKKVTTIDVTTHDTDDNYMDFIASLKDGGEVSLALVFDPNDITHSEAATVVGTNAGGLNYLFEQRVKRSMRLALPVSPAARWAFTGLVTAFEPDMKVTDALRANCTIKVSKKPTLEAGIGGPS